MRAIVLSLLLVLCTSTCFANVYMVVNSSTKEIITASEKNDAPLKAGQELVTLQGTFANLELNAPITDYKYTNKFILNTQKIEKQEQDKVKKDTDLASVKTKLKALGFTDDEIKLIVR